MVALAVLAIPPTGSAKLVPVHTRKRLHRKIGYRVKQIVMRRQHKRGTKPVCRKKPGWVPAPSSPLPEVLKSSGRIHSDPSFTQDPLNPHSTTWQCSPIVH